MGKPMKDFSNLLTLAAAAYSVNKNRPITNKIDNKIRKPNRNSTNTKNRVVAGKSNVQRVNRILRGTTGIITQSNFAAHHPASKKVATMELVVPNKVITSNYPLQLGVFAGFQNALVNATLNWAQLGALNSLLPPATSSTNEGPKQLVVKSVEKVYTMTNNTNATMELDIYDIVLKKDVPKSQLVLSNGIYYTLLGDPWTYWKQGTLATEGQASTFTPTPAELLGVLPSDSPFFKDYFKVLQKKTVHLPLGSGHRHTVNLTPNWLVKESEMTSSVYNGLAGHTMYCMFVVRGFPVTDTSGALITTSAGNIAVVVSERTRYCFVSDNRTSGYYLDGLSTPADIDQSLINAATGAIDTLKQV